MEEKNHVPRRWLGTGRALTPGWAGLWIEGKEVLKFQSDAPVETSIEPALKGQAVKAVDELDG